MDNIPAVEVKPRKSWWCGSKDVEPHMKPVREAISRHVEKGAAWTDIYNRSYEAVYDAIRAQAERDKPPQPLTLEQLRERIGNPVWISGLNRWGIIGEKRVTEIAYHLVIGFDYGWEWLSDVVYGERKAYDRPPEGGA